MLNRCFFRLRTFILHDYASHRPRCLSILTQSATAEQASLLAVQRQLIKLSSISPFDRALVSNEFLAAVGLEIARLFAASPESPPVPLIFLFNGAEETFSMGAHGFISGHKWMDSIGAVINIESTGPGGPDLLFQAAGKELWPVRVYSEVVPYPRASVIAQVKDRFSRIWLPFMVDDLSSIRQILCSEIIDSSTALWLLFGKGWPVGKVRTRMAAH